MRRIHGSPDCPPGNICLKTPFPTVPGKAAGQKRFPEMEGALAGGFSTLGDLGVIWGGGMIGYRGAGRSRGLTEGSWGQRTMVVTGRPFCRFYVGCFMWSRCWTSTFRGSSRFHEDMIPVLARRMWMARVIKGPLTHQCHVYPCFYPVFCVLWSRPLIPSTEYVVLAPE